MATEKSYRDYLDIDQQIANMEIRIAQQTDLDRKIVQIDYLCYLKSVKKNKPYKGVNNSVEITVELIY